MKDRLFPLIAVSIFIFSFEGSEMPAQGFSYGSGYSYPYDVPVYGNRFNGGSVMGYVYDPYASGRFKAPDLLNDPLFRAQHKFDSHFPGRYSAEDRVKYYHSQPRQSHSGARPSGGILRNLFGG
ncbi:MAG: hypothetical protein AAF664_11780 [Planctomycetota bacterium]